MNPGRFVSLSLLYLGMLWLVGFLYEVATGQYHTQSLLYTLAIVLPPLTLLGMGVVRIENAEQEEWPQEYGRWIYGAIIFLVGMTGWFVYIGLF